MNKKLLAVAVAAALAPALSQAQSSSVVLSGALNLFHQNISASGASAGNANIVSRNGIQEGNGSNIRFYAEEDLGNGLKAWGQVESAVFLNADTRVNAAGTAAGGAGTWGNRNSGVGLKSAAWGGILLGVWDVHYHTQYGTDPSLLKGASHQSTLGLLNNMGTGSYSIGGRYSNVIRYDSPNWNGFTVGAAYARPTDGVVPTGSAATANLLDGKKNNVISINPSYSNGPFNIFYSYLKDADVAGGAAQAAKGGALFTAAGGVGALPAGLTLSDVRSDRAGGSWKFPFGLQVGLIYDRTKYSNQHQATAAAAGLGLAVGTGYSSDQKRTVWAIPLVYDFGNHTVNFTYAKASDITGSFSTPAGSTSGKISATGAKMWQLGYQYAMSKRTNIHASYTRINNDSNANYDGFANGVGLGAAGNNGADPTYVVVGLRHTF